MNKKEYSSIYSSVDSICSIIEEHFSKEAETNLFFGHDVVRLTTADGLTVLRSVYCPGAGAIANELLRGMVKPAIK